MKQFDVAIIGGGVAGLGAAIYSRRLGLKTAVFYTESGGAITKTDIVENYPGFECVSGQEIADKIREHALCYKPELINQEVASVGRNDKLFVIKTKNNQYLATTVIFATGSKWRKLNIPDSKKFEGKGISYCAICDGPLFKNKIVAVVGGSDTAAKEALLLTQYAKKVFIIYRGEKIHPEHACMKKVEDKIAKGKIEIINRTNIRALKGKTILKTVILDRPYKGKKELNLNGIFIAIGRLPLSHLAKQLGVKLNKEQEIITDKTAKTNVPGVYAAGDVTNSTFKQAIVGVAEGTIAAYNAYEYITKGSCPLE
jgi:thioredoxin reductase (NADPH)